MSHFSLPTDVSTAADPSAPTTTPSPCGSEPDEAHVAQLMAAIAAGDEAAVWKLREVADAPIRRIVRGQLRRLGVRYEIEELDGLVMEAVLALRHVAKSWQPGLAPPWVWARHRVIRVVHDFSGTFADSLEELGDGDPDAAAGWLGVHDTHLPTSGGRAVDPPDVIDDTLATLRNLAERHSAVAALGEALSEVASTRDAALWVATLEERASGNQSPAVTVAARFGMSPTAVRKANQRTWDRLTSRPDASWFAEVSSLPFVAERLALAA